jgi:hypothetical protein
VRPIPPAQELGGVPVIFAKDQPEYLQLPARSDGHSVVTTWELTAAERVAILAGASIILQVSTFGQPLQPLSIYVQGVEEEAGQDE